jgi:hypothetical protein
MRFGREMDMKAIIAPSPDADRAVRYLTKYLTKAISEPLDDDDGNPAREAHLDRMHAELQFLPCSPRCANWLRYGIQPEQPAPGLIPGRCLSKAHDQDHLGLGGRRVLVSRQWSGKTLSEHKADRATVVREALTSAGIDAPELDRMAASVTLPDGSPRFVWTDAQSDVDIYARVILASVLERQQWRTLYQTAKACQVAVDSLSATGQPP